MWVLCGLVSALVRVSDQELFIAHHLVPRGSEVSTYKDLFTVSYTRVVAGGRCDPRGCILHFKLRMMRSRGEKALPCGGELAL